VVAASVVAESVVAASVVAALEVAVIVLVAELENSDCLAGLSPILLTFCGKISQVNFLRTNATYFAPHIFCQKAKLQG